MCCFSSGRLWGFSAFRSKSGDHVPIPQKPMTPTAAKPTPTTVLRRSSRLLNNSEILPSWEAPVCLACSQRSGSFTNMRMANVNSAGMTPTPKTHRQPRFGEEPIVRLMSAAAMLPTAEAACIMPKAVGRA